MKFSDFLLREELSSIAPKNREKKYGDLGGVLTVGRKPTEHFFESLPTLPSKKK
jgi:hypothetical protein